MTEQELLDIKNKIENAKENLANLKGREEALLEQMQKQFGVKTIAAAERKIKQIEAEIQEWDEKIETATEELQNKLNEGESTSTEESIGTGEGTEESDSKRPVRRKR